MKPALGPGRRAARHVSEFAAVITARMPNRPALPLVLVLAGALLAGCGSQASTSATPSAATAAPSAAATPSATPTPTSSAAATATPSGTTLTITEYGVALTLPDSVSDAVYSIDASGWGPGPTSQVDADGTSYTMLPPIRIWTRSLTADEMCSAVTTDGLVTISVFETDPTNLILGSGPSDYKQIRRYWFGISLGQADECTDGNPAEATSAAALLNAYDTIHAA